MYLKLKSILLLLTLSVFLNGYQSDMEMLSNISIDTFYPLGKSNEEVLDFIDDPDGYMWIITTRGLYRYDGFKSDDSLNLLLVRKGISNKIKSLIPQNNKVVVILTTDGKHYKLNLINRTLEQIKGKKDYGSIYKSRTKIIDSRGNQWLSKNGLWISTPENRYLIKKVPEENTINSIREVKNDIWIAYNNGKISRVSNYNDTVVNYLDFNGESITSIKELNNVIYLGTKRGLFSFNRKNSYKERILEDSVLSIDLHNNNLWVGTTNGIKKYNLSKKSIEDTFLPELKIIAIYTYNSSLFGVTMFNGIFEYTNNRWVKVKKTGSILDLVYFNGRDSWSSLTTGSLTSNLLIIDGKTYLGTMEQGILNSPLSGKAVTSINSFKNYIVFTGREGIGYYNIDAGSYYWLTNLDIMDWGTINTNSSFLTKNNELFLGRDNGLIRVDLNKLSFQNPKSYISISDISLFDDKNIEKITQGSESIILKWPYRSFRFSVKVKNSQLQNIRYKYKLQGHSNKWITNSLNGEFIDIPPGEYSLIITADTPYKELLDLTTSMPVKVINPFWMKITYRVLIACLLTLIIIVSILISTLRKNHLVRKERNRIARDLHDSVSQTLFSASLTADILPELLLKDEETGLKKVREISYLTKGAQQEMRTLLYELRPDIFKTHSFREIIIKLIESFNGKKDIKLRYNISDTNTLSHKSKLAIYRILQEAINNSLKHSKCSELDIELYCYKSRFKLTIENNGIRFNPHKGSFGMGLKLMNERAQSINASLSIESTDEVTRYSLLRGKV